MGDSLPTSAVLHVADYTARYGGNFIASLKTLREPCAANGWRLVLAFPAAAEQHAWCRDLAREYTVRYLPPASLAGDTRAIRALALQESALLLHTHFIHYDLAAWLAAWGPVGARRLPVVWHAHSSLSARRTWKRPWKNLVKYRLAGRRVQMIAVSPFVAQELEQAGVPASRVRAILNGIDLPRATHVPCTRSGVFAKLGMQPDQQLLLMIGWDPQRKGADLAIEAVRPLTGGNALVLGILGTERLGEFVEDQGGLATMPWLRIIPPTEDMASLFAAATMFLSPSRSEGFTYAACEAMAVGTPVVLADIAPVAWARGCPAAAFCAVNDAAALRGAIQHILSWPAEERQRRTRQSQEFARENFDAKQWAQQIVTAYQDILGETT
jgi:glycosyltransferase involved in cell wall biosynthesis